jgi:hypothetical protein
MTTRPSRPGALAVAAAFAAVALALTGCSPEPGSSAAPPAAATATATPTPTVAPVSEALAPEGSTFTLADVVAGPFNADTVQQAFGETAVEFSAPGEAAGSAGCRTFTATYAHDAAEDTVRITDLVVDDSACPAGSPALDDIVGFIEQQTFTADATAEADSVTTLTLTTLDGLYALAFVATA